MKSAPLPEAARRLVLDDVAASELMTPNPVSVREGATLRELVELFTRRGISGAPVIDEAGHPVGVVTHSDILIHERAAVESAGGEGEAATTVRDIMTPVVFCVSPGAPASRVVREMVELKVHRLFVVDDNGTLVGVISVFDVLCRLTSL